MTARTIGTFYLGGIFFAAAALTSCSAPTQSPDTKTASREVASLTERTEARVDDLLQKLTLEEKIELLHGNEMETHPIARLGIPALKMTDGPIGVRWGHATSFPSGIAWAATFNPKLLNRITEVLATETLAKGRDMLLGPCVNIARAPQGGRNMESFGEDPYLSSIFSKTYVHGLQSHGVITSLKHFALNDQETERNTINVLADERTLHEIHLPAFQAAVNAGTWSVMASYNQVDGTHSSENDFLLNQILKSDWGFQGFVISDWDATHSTVNAANHGLDLEFPNGKYFGDGKLLKAIEDGKVSRSLVDDKVRRVLRAMVAMGVLDRKDSDRPPLSAVNQPAHQKLALETAQQSLVLLKNDHDVLPIQVDIMRIRPETIAILGPNAAFSREGGGGSSHVVPTHAVSALEGLRDRANGQPLELRYTAGIQFAGDVISFDSDEFQPDSRSPLGAQGLRGEYFDNRDFKGKPVLTRVDPKIDFNWGTASPGASVPDDRFSVRWTGIFKPKKWSNQQLALRADDGARVYLDGKLVLDTAKPHLNAGPFLAKARLRAGHSYRIRIEYFENTGDASIQLGWVPIQRKHIDEAVQLAAHSDTAIIFAGYSDDLESEGIDRASLTLPNDQDQLIQAVAKVNPRTIVVLNSGGSVLMPWRDQVAAIVQAWYPGEQGGNAIADLIFGRINPSGKLPVSFYARPQDASSYGAYPGKNGVVRYSEGVFVGYRHLDRNKIAPLFPFGHGLSYTRFEVRDLQINAVNDLVGQPDIDATVQITNTGSRPGAEVLQLYVQEMAPTLDRPVQELKGFERVELEPQQSKLIRFKLRRDAFAFYDTATHSFRVMPGRFNLRVGTSSRDIRAERTLSLR